MNDDVINHAIKWCNDQMRMCESGFLIHDGGKDDALVRLIAGPTRDYAHYGCL